MDKGAHRFALSADKYIEKHQVMVYIEDAITQLLEHKEDNPKVNPTKFFSEYFTSVKEGNHTLFREYNFVQKTLHNRSSFVTTFWKCFRNIGRKGDLLNTREYHSLLCLLCSDFPFGIVQKTARIILLDDAMDCLISFSDFLCAFQVQFCFEEFLLKCDTVYQELQKASSQDPVVVPTSEEGPPPTPHGPTPIKPDGVDSMQFFRALVPVCEKLDTLAPPVAVLKEILNGAERVTFYGFLMALAKSDTLNASVGKLPKKSELLDVAESELASMKAGKGKVSTKNPNKQKGGAKKSARQDDGTINQSQDSIEKIPSSVSGGITHPPRPVTAGLATTPTPTHHDIINNINNSNPASKSKLLAVKRRIARSEARQNMTSSSDDSDDSDT